MNGFVSIETIKWYLHKYFRRGFLLFGKLMWTHRCNSSLKGILEWDKMFPSMYSLTSSVFVLLILAVHLISSIITNTYEILLTNLFRISSGKDEDIVFEEFFWFSFLWHPHISKSINVGLDFYNISRSPTIDKSE